MRHPEFMRRFIALLRKEVRQMLRDKSNLAVGLLLPWTSKVASYGLALVLTVGSFVQASTWTQAERLWRQAVEAAPRKVRPRVQLARVLPPREALGVLAEAQSFAPNDANVASPASSSRDDPD